jgi:hypothetical protein
MLWADWSAVMYGRLMADYCNRELDLAFSADSFNRAARARHSSSRRRPHRELGDVQSVTRWSKSCRQEYRHWSEHPELVLFSISAI